MKKILCLLLVISVCYVAYSQAWVWEKQITTTNNKVTTDALDNIILLSRNGTATQLTKYTKNGGLIWTKRLSKATAVTPGGSAVADNSGNIYVFTEGFDSVNSVFTGVKISGITKFNPQGNILWHTNYNVVNSNINNRLDIKLGDDNNIYTGVMTFGSGPGASLQLGNTSATLASSTYNLSIGSVTSAGVPRWLRSFPCTTQGGQISATAITVAGNKIFIAGNIVKYILTLDNGQSINLGRCSSWLAAFDQTNGQSQWIRGHSLYVFCLGMFCGCYTPTIDANTATGRVMLNNNLMGGFVFNGTDTIKSTNDPNIVIYKSYNTIYDTNNVPIKGKTIQTIPNGFSYNENLLGSRGNTVYALYSDSLRKMDTGYNIIWVKKLEGLNINVTGGFIPQNNNDILLCYSKNGSNYLGKISDSAAVVSGKVYADWDNNGIYTNTDTALSNILLTDNTSPASTLSSNDSGKYFMYVVPGNHNVSANFPHPYYQFLPATHSVTINQFGDTVSGKDFRLRPLFAFSDVSTTFTDLNIARAGRQALYSVSVKNWGATVSPIQVGLKIPALTTYNSITGATVTVNAPDSVTVDMGNVNPFEVKKATLILNIATTATITDTLHFYPKAYPYTTDILQSNNIDTLVQPIRGSFDPNDKQANAAGRHISDVGNDIEYTVRFQNTGNDTAFYVRIADTLSAKLDLHSFNFIDASHPVSVEIKNNVLQFIFNPIQLPDSNINEPASHGFVKFSCRPAATVIAGDTVFNNAAIYFDYNSPVITNTAKSWYYSNVALPVTIVSLNATPAANTVIVKFVTAQEINLKTFIIERGSDGVHFNAAGTVIPYGNISGGTYYFTDNSPVKPIGFYRLKIIDNDGRFRYSNLAAAKFTNDNKNGISIFPNPASDNLLLLLNGTANKATSYKVTDITGKIILKKVISGTAAGNTFVINVSSLSAGIYNIELAAATGETYSQNFVISR